MQGGMDGGRSAPMVPAPAWFLGVVTFLALLFLAFGTARAGGQQGFYGPSDPRSFRAVAHDPFGDGGTVAALGQPAEASYRYGRIGLPLVAWIAAAGHQWAVGWSLVLVNLIAISAIPLLAAVLLSQLGVEPRLAALTLLVPGLLILYSRVYAEPLALAAVLGALIAERRARIGLAIALLAFAVLTRETAAVVVIALFARDLVRRAPHPGRWLLALVPYAMWATWVRVRVGEFPFLANVSTRRDAFRLPFMGMAQAIRDGGADATVSVVLCLATAIGAGVVAWRMRNAAVGAATLALGLFALCLGPSALVFTGETLRLLIPADVLLVVCIAVTIGSRRPARSRTEVAVESRQ